MNIQETLKKAHLTPDPLKDQFFLMDDHVTQQMVDLANLDNKDVVLEIGTGMGNLTRKLAKKAGRVISFEIDERFKLFLSDLPTNVNLRFEDAWEYIQLHGKFWQKREYNKVVANLPYSFAEKFLHNLTFLKYDKVILLVSQSLAQKIEDNPVFGSFFIVKEKFKVDKNKFYPIPRTNSVVIDLIKLPDAIVTKNLSLFLRQYLYQHEETKVKNSLREGLIKYYYLTENEAPRVKNPRFLFKKRLLFDRFIRGLKATRFSRSANKRLTKKQAVKIINEAKLNLYLLEETPGLHIYDQVSQKLEKLEIFSSNTPN